MSYPSEPGFTYGLPGVVHGLTLCAPTGILTLNVLLGDAIVWWRAWIIWPRSLIVRGTCVVLLAVTTAFSELTLANLDYIPIGSFYRLDVFGVAASVSSLSSNLVATVMIGCKAWEHRKMFEATTLERSSRIERLLVLLVESGTVYCLLWGFILAYQTSSFTDPALESRLEQQVLTGFDYFMKGCLIPLIGIYPTTIIVLVALNRSHFHGTVSTDKLVSHVVFRHQPDITNDEAASSLHTAAEVSSCGGRNGQLGADEDCSKGFMIADKESPSSYLRGPDRARPLTIHEYLQKGDVESLSLLSDLHVHPLEKGLHGVIFGIQSISKQADEAMDAVASTEPAADLSSSRTSSSTLSMMDTTEVPL
ncbi:hypothetical protein DICSQDRAFT_130336 [Dichomitus squalens LYAD-421 SS1]|uniref:Uncharacterized protein n=1 Tax=Dichomitus squalens (strain LYAD-421) TaxID=732165 RepID=R7SLQ9_DICSQ|nr:uncharacterized protein DICSQDRAFT_130336 [Dichomitus squalens LYAD-421 SS1]EJF55977.1 hypothetical protein DICSQDRAFT_130336 [Dichomitus squalens LYAD-421 SS1]